VEERTQIKGKREGGVYQHFFLLNEALYWFWEVMYRKKGREGGLPALFPAK
jgi:hypothetical protein